MDEHHPTYIQIILEDKTGVTTSIFLALGECNHKFMYCALSVVVNVSVGRLFNGSAFTRVNVNQNAHSKRRQISLDRAQYHEPLSDRRGEGVLGPNVASVL